MALYYYRIALVLSGYVCAFDPLSPVALGWNPIGLFHGIQNKVVVTIDHQVIFGWNTTPLPY